MFEQIPKLFNSTKEKEIKNELPKTLEGIPIFEHLDDKSKKFVLHIKELNIESEEEYFAKRPEIAEMVEKNRETEGIKRLFLKRHFDHTDYEINTLYHEGKVSGSRIRNFATMWDLVRLRLYELEDAQNPESFHSKRTERLAEKICFNLYGVVQGGNWFPDAAKDIGYELEKKGPPLAVNDQLILIHTVLNLFHEHDSRQLPCSMFYVSGLWKFALEKIYSKETNAVNVFKKDDPDNRDWPKAVKLFYDSLSNLNLKGDFKN
ncbi:MAG: hypothetical protein EHM58_02460 [Ignavibacteriae bacterium]|nr:MAG: hypothetical protein EHM58_02460 [Ignavibacteriota bacterium]